MRSKFPVLWVIQFIVLFCLSINNFARPIGVLEFHRGQLAPQPVEMPRDALYRWVLGLEEISPANQIVKEFFLNHDQVTHREKNIWTPHDRSLQSYLESALESALGKSNSAVVQNKAWEEVENWIRTAQPPASADEAVAIQAWLEAIDQIPAPSEELITWVVEQQEPLPPPTELRIMILEAQQTLPISWGLAADQIRLAASCVMAAALFTLLGLMTPSIRRPLARVFVIVAIFWTNARLKSSTGPPDWNMESGVMLAGLALGLGMVVTALKAVPRITTGATMFAMVSIWWVGVVVVAAFAKFDAGSQMARFDIVFGMAIVAIFGIANANYWLIGKSEDPPQDDAGIAQRRPPQLWTTWLVQFGILTANGLLALVFPSWIAELFTHASVDHLATDIVDDSVRLLGTWTIGMALFSHFALGVGKDWIWQGISVIFCLVFATLALSMLVFGASGEYTVWAYVYSFQGVIFIPITVAMLMRKDPWSIENVERATKEDWKLTDLIIGSLLMWRPLWSGKRELYRHGVGVRGHLRVLPLAPVGNSQMRPDNEFFSPGEEFEIEMRFSNRSCADDAALDIRGCAIRFSREEASPLDLMFATGAYAPVSTLTEFRLALPFQNQKKLIEHNSIIREGFAAGVRRAPQSYALLSYHDPFTLEWLSPDARHYLVRLRVIPANTQTEITDLEQGIPAIDDLQHLWVRERHQDETRRPDYLRQELSQQISANGSVAFQLQVQFHEPGSNDSLDWYDASVEWDITACPWYPLAEVTLTETMDKQEGENVRFDPSNLPPSLHVPSSPNLASFTDPRAIAAARFRIAHVIGQCRIARNRLKKKR